MRWQHPSRGLVAPGEFIAVAEETGLIVPLGYAVMRSVCQQLAEWESKASAAARLSVGVNLSTRQLLIPDLPERLRQITGEFGVDPARIDLEITETSMMADPAAVVHNWRGLAAGPILRAREEEATRKM